MRKKLLSSLILGITVALACVVPASADSRKVVTLGADLTSEQQNTMMRYFGVDYNSVDVIYINNTDERNHLGAYVPLEQIGNKTFSCALVAPTTTGGIKVKTANLDWVTCNMIASTLSTSGVTNCQVVAASPFKVSGTGALTGVIMAYEQASQQTLDPVKKDLANQELVVTGNLADEVGQSAATAIINETKEIVIENNITDITDITNVVNNVTNNYNTTVSDQQTELIAEMMQQIAQQEYDIEQLKATLDNVKANVAEDAGASAEQVAEFKAEAEASQAAADQAAIAQAEAEGFTVEYFDDDSQLDILDNTDVTALEDANGGAGTVNEGDTTSTVAEQAAAEEEQGPKVEDLTDPEDRACYEAIDKAAKELFKDRQVSDDYGTTVYLTQDAADKLPKLLSKYALKILVDGGSTVAFDESMDPELQQYATIVKDTEGAVGEQVYNNADMEQIDRYVRRLIFKDSEKILADCELDAADEIVLFEEIMKLFEEAFDVDSIEEEPIEVEDVEDIEAPAEEVVPEEVYEEPAEEAVDEFAGFEEQEEVYE